MSILTESDFNLHCKWNNSNELLSDYVDKTQLPSIVRIKSGQYEQFGKKYHNALYIHSSKSEVYALAENQMSNVKNSLFAIPIFYPGWFELLNESRRTLKPLSFGKELINNNSNIFLVRKNFRVKYLNDSNETMAKAKYKVLCAGELIYVPQKQPFSDFSEKEESYISCEDKKGNVSFISLKQKIFLSPISENDDFLGVYSIKDLCRKFVFPVSVQLAFGEYQGSYKYHPIFRLVGYSRLSTAIVSPLNHPSLVTNMPINELVLVDGITNVEEIKKSPEWSKLTKEAEEKKTIADTMMFSVVSGKIKIYKGDKKKENFFEIDNNLLPIYDQINDIYRYIRDGVFPDENQHKDYQTNNEINYKTLLEKNNIIDLPEPNNAPWKEPSYKGVFEIKKLETKMNENEKSSQISNLALRSEVTFKKNNYSQSLKAKKVNEMKKARKFSIFSNKESKLQVESGSEDEDMSIWNDEKKIDKITKARDVFKLINSNNLSTVDPESNLEITDKITLAKDVLNISNSMKSTLKLPARNITFKNNSPEASSIKNISDNHLSDSNNNKTSLLPNYDTPKYQKIDTETDYEGQTGTINRKPNNENNILENIDTEKEINFYEDVSHEIATPENELNSPHNNDLTNFENPKCNIKSHINDDIKIHNDIEVSKLINNEHDLSSETKVLKHFNKVVLNESFDQIENTEIAVDSSQIDILEDDILLNDSAKNDTIKNTSLKNIEDNTSQIYSIKNEVMIEQCLEERKLFDESALGVDSDKCSLEYEIPNDELETFESDKLENNIFSDTVTNENSMFSNTVTNENDIYSNTVTSENFDHSESKVMKDQQRETLNIIDTGIFEKQKEKIISHDSNKYQNKEKTINIKSFHSHFDENFQEVIKSKDNLDSVRYANSREALVKSQRGNNRLSVRINNDNNSNHTQEFSHEYQINNEKISQESVENIGTRVNRSFDEKISKDKNKEFEIVDKVEHPKSFSVAHSPTFDAKNGKSETSSEVLKKGKIGILGEESCENTLKKEKVKKNLIKNLKEQLVTEKNLITNDKKVNDKSLDEQKIENHKSTKLITNDTNTSIWGSSSKKTVPEFSSSADPTLLTEHHIKPHFSHSQVYNTSTPGQEKSVSSEDIFLSNIINKKIEGLENKKEDSNITGEKNKIMSLKEKEDDQENMHNLSINELPSYDDMFGKARTNEIKKQIAPDETLILNQEMSIQDSSIRKKQDSEIHKQSMENLSKYSHIGHQIILSTIPAQPTTLRGGRFRFGSENFDDENACEPKDVRQGNTSTSTINKKKSTFKVTDSLNSKIISSRFNEDSASLMADDTKSTIKSSSKTSVIHFKNHFSRQQSTPSALAEKQCNNESESFEKNMNTLNYQKSKKKFGKNSLKKLFSKSTISINSDYRDDSTKLTAWSSKSDLDRTIRNYSEDHTNGQQSLKFKTTAIKINGSNQKSNNQTEENTNPHYHTETFTNYQNFSFPYQTIQKFPSNNTHISIRAPSQNFFASNSNKTTVFNKATFSESVTPNQVSKIVFTN